MDKTFNHLPSDEQINKISSFYNALSDTTRLKILYLILQNDICVTEIAKVLEISQPAVSYQLRILKQLNIVDNVKNGKSIFYKVKDSTIETILKTGLEKNK